MLPALYVRTTADATILDESVPFLKAPDLEPDQDDDLRLPGIAEQPGSLYEHCLRALERAWRLGAHGLPLIGTGDWNDGMNRGRRRRQGRERLAGLVPIATILDRFAGWPRQEKTLDRAADSSQPGRPALERLEANAWDGQWYRRAYFDDGTPLGSAENDACQIDSLAQSWAVLCGRPTPTAPPAMTVGGTMLVGCRGN